MLKNKKKAKASKKAYKVAKNAAAIVASPPLPYRKGVSIPRQTLAQLAAIRDHMVKAGATAFPLQRPGWEALVIGEIVSQRAVDVLVRP